MSIVSSSSSSKHALYSDSEDAQPNKRSKSTRSTAATSKDNDKVMKRAERMERNRKAAQLSRDRKKMAQAELEARVQELEEQLNTRSPAASTFRSLSPAPSSAIVVDETSALRISTLETENAVLRRQLEDETAKTLVMSTRLSDLEAQVAALIARSTPSQPVLVAPTPILPLSFDFTALLDPPSTGTTIDEEEESADDEQGRRVRLVAREAFTRQRTLRPLPRRLSSTTARIRHRSMPGRPWICQNGLSRWEEGNKEKRQRSTGRLLSIRPCWKTVPKLRLFVVKR